MYLVSYFCWYILVSRQKNVELLVLPTCIQMLWHEMTHRKSRRDGTDVSARAPLEPASWAFHWEGQVEVLLWWLFLCFSLLAFTQPWIRIANKRGCDCQPPHAALDFCCFSQWGTGDESLRPQGDEELKGRFEGESSGKSPALLLKQWRGKTQFLPLISGKRQPCWESGTQAK